MPFLRFTISAALRINPAHPRVFAGRFSSRRKGTPMAAQLVSNEVHVATCSLSSFVLH
jgi:hypothetical protein